MEQEDAVNYIVHRLRDGRCGNYGYDLYIRGVIDSYTYEYPEQPLPQQSGSYRHGLQDPRVRQGERAKEISPLFYGAAWELCRRGILRPGVRKLGEQATSDGEGYSLTPYGHIWLAEEPADFIVSTDPTRYGAMLLPLRDRLGAAFHIRAQEASRCYQAHAYLACCAMCGAAALSITLALVSRLRPNEDVIRIYASSEGRTRLETLALGTGTKQDQNQLRGYWGLLDYWYEEAVGDAVSGIDENEAHTALMLLLRFALYADKRLSVPSA